MGSVRLSFLTGAAGSAEAKRTLHTQLRRRKASAPWLIVAILLVSSSALGAAVSATAPWEEGYAYDAFLYRRLAYVLDGLRTTARSEPALKDVLDQIRLRTPKESLIEEFPNAYAIPGADTRFIIVESRFVDQIAALSAAGAYLAIKDFDGAHSYARAQICLQLGLEHFRAREKGTTPVFTVEYEKFPEFTHPPSGRGLTMMTASIADDAMVWFLLHEAGHHARASLGHEPPRPETNADSRQRESEADRWASQTMIRLGFGLFGIERYLSGRAAIEECLQHLGYEQNETESTHPSWLRRAENMRSEFEVTTPGRGYPRRFYIPAEPSDIWVLVAPPGDDAGSFISQDHRMARAASEWRGQAVTIRARSLEGGRIEFEIPDANLGVLEVIQTTFDSANQQLGSPIRLLSMQFNPASVDWVELEPGITFGDLRRDDQYLMKKYLRELGASDVTIVEFASAFEEFRSAEAPIVIAFMKGHISSDELALRYGPLSAALERRMMTLLGADRFALLLRMVANDPIARWRPGLDPEHYRKLEEEVLNRNFPD